MGHVSYVVNCRNGKGNRMNKVNFEDVTGYELIIFDIDGTLSDRDTEELLPNVAQWFKNKGSNFNIAFATNQGGVGLRHWMEEEGFGTPDGYPTEDKIKDKIHSLVKKLELFPYGSQVVNSYIAYSYQSKKSGKWSPIPKLRSDNKSWLPEWRKPNPSMLLQAMKDFGIPPNFTMMIGDREEDHEAAENAGILSIDADKFFGRK